MSDGTLKFETKLDLTGLKKGMTQAEKEAEKQAKDLDKRVQEGRSHITQLGNVAKIAGGYIVGKLFKESVTAGIDFNREMEVYTASFETMTGSAEEASKIMTTINDLASKTPFATKDLADSVQLLMNYGIEGDKAVSVMSMLGDISQGNADKLGRISTAYGQMSSTGRVTLEDINQMIEAGFNPLNEISKTTGESMVSLRDRISDGTLSVDEITKSMERSTTEGGKYFGSMDKQSETLDGRLSTLGDTFSATLGEKIQPFSDFLRDELIPFAIDLLENFEKYEPTLVVLGVGIGTITALFIAYNIQQALASTGLTGWSAVAKLASPVTTALGGAFTFLTSPISLVIIAIGAVIAIIYLLIKNWDDVKLVIDNFVKWINTKFKPAWDKAWNAVKDSFKKIFEGIVNAGKAPLNALIGLINLAIDGLNSLSISFPSWVPFVGGKSFAPNIEKIPLLEKGGILKRGQMGFLEGNGAEAVVPLDRNKHWIRAVAKEMANMNSSVTTNNNGQTIVFNGKVDSIDEISRKLRVDARLGLAG